MGPDRFRTGSVLDRIGLEILRNRFWTGPVGVRGVAWVLHGFCMGVFKVWGLVFYPGMGLGFKPLSFFGKSLRFRVLFFWKRFRV